MTAVPAKARRAMEDAYEEWFPCLCGEGVFCDAHVGPKVVASMARALIDAGWQVVPAPKDKPGDDS